MRRSALVLPALLAIVVGATVVGSLAAFTSRAENAGSVVNAIPDLAEPTVGATAIAKTQGGSAGFVKRSGTYQIYASIADTGNPASGIGTVTADVSTITTGSTAVPLTAGTYTVDGQSYNYASAQQTAGSGIAAGSLAWTLRAADAAANSQVTAGMPVTADITAPTATDVQTTNVAAGMNGRPEIGDVVTFTFSEPIEPASILSGWTGAAVNVVARIADGGVSNDTLTVYDAANATLTQLGSVGLGATGYVTAATTFGASGAASRMTLSGSTITISLGTVAGTVGTSATTGTLRWTPSASAYDRAAIAMATTARNETGTADKDF